MKKTNFLWLSVIAALLMTGMGAWCLHSSTLPREPLVETIRQKFPQLAGAMNGRSEFVGDSRSVDGKTIPGFVPRVKNPAPAGLNAVETEAWLAAARGRNFLAPFFPNSFADPVVVEGGLVKAELHAKDANPTKAVQEDGKIVYRNAYPHTDSVHVVSAARSEEFLLLQDNGAPRRFEYTLNVNPDACVREIDGAISITSPSGSGLHIEPPYVVDAGGRHGQTAVKWELNKASVKGSYTLALVLDARNLTYPLVIDPTWVSTGTMVAARYGHTATLLNNGTVLVVGGTGPGGVCHLVEIFDPQKQTWRAAKNSLPPNAGVDNRTQHTATLLSTGQVLVVGNPPGSGSQNAMLFDPTTETWQYVDKAIPSPAGGFQNTLVTPRYGHVAVTMPNGNVMIIGGKDTSNTTLKTIEMYVPGSGFMSTPPAPMANVRYGHTATMLANGDLLVAGGDAGGTSELFSGGTWKSAVSMVAVRSGHTSTLMPDGTVVAIAGNGTNKTAELYSPGGVGVNGSWSATTGSLTNARVNHTATLMPSGKLAVIYGDAVGTEESYSFSTKSFAAAVLLSSANAQHTATLLGNGKVMVCGGTTGTIQSAAYYFNDNVDSVAATPSTSFNHDNGAAFLLNNGSILVTPGSGTKSEVFNAGAWGNPQTLFSTNGGAACILPNGKVLSAAQFASQTPQLYDPTAGTWSPTGQITLTYPDTTTTSSIPFDAGLTVLPNGNVLIAGGYSAGFTLNFAQIYNPATGTWSNTGFMKNYRRFHTCTLLQNGKVLVAGGTDNYDGSCELFDPATGTWTATGSLNTGRLQHTATLLNSGKVLVAGGTTLTTPATTSCELYDPATGTWSALTMSVGRNSHTATLLNNGTVLIAGGSSGSGSLTSVELYDPSNSLTPFSTATSLSTARSGHAAVLQSDGTVLFINGDGALTTEKYNPIVIPGSPQPMISAGSFPGSLALGSKLVITGTKFTGISESSSGGNSNDSASNIPMVELTSLVNGYTTYLSPDPTSGWTSTSFTSVAVTGYPPGPARVTVIANGVPSTSLVTTLTNNATTLSAGTTPPAATVNTAFSGNLSVTVLNNGTTPQSVPYVPVTFTVNPNGASGFFPGNATTVIVTADVNGIATAPTLTANPTAGTFTLTASANGATSATFNLTNNAGTPTLILPGTGSPQNGTVNTVYNIFSINIRDQFNNAAPNNTVFFNAPTNSGSVPTGLFLPSQSITGTVSKTNGSTTLTISGGTFTATAGDIIRVVGGGQTEDRVVAATVTGTTSLTVTVAYSASGSSSSAILFQSGGTLTSSCTTTTDSSGNAYANPMKANTVTGSFSVVGSVPGVGNTLSLNFKNMAGAGATIQVNGLPTSRTAGSPGSVSVAVLDVYNNIATGYTGTVKFQVFDQTSTDISGTATLPPNYQFQGVDQGMKTFNLVLNKVGTNQSLTVTDTLTSTITGSETGITVSPSNAAALTVSGFPNSTAGIAGSVTVTALDAYGNVATGYSGTVVFSSSDPQAVLPSNTTLASGTGTFSVTLKTSGTQNIKATDTVNLNLQGIQNGITISPAATASLTVSGLSSATAGTAVTSLTVTAKDAFNNVVPTYAGTVKFTSSDAAAVLPANSTLTSGTGTFSVTFKTAQMPPQTLTATDTVTSTITGSQNVNVSAATATTLSVSGFSSTIAGNFGNFVVQAKDAFGNVAPTYTGTIAFTSTDSQAGLPGSYTFVPGDQGQHFFNGVLKTAGSQTITATDSVTSSITGAQTITINPAATSKFGFAGLANGTAGTAQTLTATAQDSFGNKTTTYSGTVRFQSSDPLAILPANYTFTGGDAGVHVFTVTFKSAATQSLSMADTVTPSISGGQSGLVISPAAATTLTLSGYPFSTVAGTSNNFTVTAKDAFGNTATGYTGTVAFSSTDAQATLPSNATFISGDAGVKTFSATFATVQTNSPFTQSLTATDTVTSSITGTQSGIGVSAAVGVTLKVSGYPAAPVAGIVNPFNVMALDTYGNVAKGYLGTVSFTSSDTQAVLPLSYTFTAQDLGQHFFNATLKTSGAQTIIATDAGNSSITGTQSSINVAPGQARTFTVSGFPNSTAGIAGTFTVTAHDAFNNVATTYLGTVAFSSSDPHAQLPAAYSFVVGDAGARIFSATLQTAGTQSIGVTDNGPPSVTGSQSGITVTAAAFSKLSISAPALANVGAAFNAVVSSTDAFGNAVSSTDTVTITTSDANAAPPLPASLINGSKSFSVTLSTTGTQTLHATDSTDGTKTSASTSVLVNVGSPARLLVLLPGETSAPGSASGKSGTASAQTAGVPFTVTVISVDVGNNLVNSTDTVAITSSDTLALSQGAVQLSSGTGTLQATLKTAGSQTLTATDTTNSNVPVNTSSAVSIQAGGFAGLTVSGFPSPATQGVPANFSVTASDAFGNKVNGYTGTVSFTSSDSAATLPANYTFTVADSSSHTFSATLKTVPSQSLTATDLNNSSAKGTQSGIVVNALVPTVSAISPTTAALNAAAFTLTVSGTNFLSSSVVQWNGSSRTTTFVSKTQLTAAIPASDLAIQGRAAVTVFTPAPGGGTSGAGTFFVYSGTTTGTWVVTNTLDSGPGSLRFAMAQSQSNDTITFDPVLFDLTNADAATLINVKSELPALSNSNVTIDAQNRRVTINGSGADSANGLTITSNGNTVMGLSIIGFTKSGVYIAAGATNNIVGGVRTTGTGPNGQGLRISNNGAFGVEIDGAGTSNNVVKGCWIGLDASGMNAEPNVAGVIIENGATSNTIGGVNAGEANVVSGNTFEGITVTGTGTDNNMLIGNLIGLPGVVSTSRDSSSDSDFGLGVGNGRAGVFLTKGTQGTQVGSGDDSSANLIGFNGGNGIEVRATTSKRNSMRHNRVGRNVQGGIALFDGSNSNVPSPVINSVTGLSGLSARAATTTSVSITGTVGFEGLSATSGTVDVYSDPGSQGRTWIASVLSTDGTFSLTANVISGQNVTATFTDSTGNTSPFSVFNIVSGGASAFSSAPAASTTATVIGTPITFTAGIAAGTTLVWDFGDGATDSTNSTSLTHSYSASGTYTVTATATPAGGSPTVATLTITVATTYSLIDTDGNGVPDELKTALGSSITDPTSLPLGLVAPVVPQTLVVSKVAVRLNFATSGTDSISITGTVALSSGFTTAGAKVAVDFGGVIQQYTLDSSGKGSNGGDSFKVSTKTGAYSAKFSRGSFASKLSDEGLTGDSNVTNASKTVVIYLIIANKLYQKSQTVTYNAKAKKLGTAK